MIGNRKLKIKTTKHITKMKIMIVLKPLARLAMNRGLIFLSNFSISWCGLYRKYVNKIPYISGEITNKKSQIADVICPMLSIVLYISIKTMARINIGSHFALSMFCFFK